MPAYQCPKCGETLERYSSRLFHCPQEGRHIVLPKGFEKTQTVEQALAAQIRSADTPEQGQATATVGELYTSAPEAPW